MLIPYVSFMVGADGKECPPAEEEGTVILTLVEISADSKDCSTSASLQQASEELLPAPVFFTADGIELVELTKEDR